VLVGIGSLILERLESAPVPAVVGRNIRAIWAYGDPEFVVGVVGYGRAIAVRWGLA